MTRKSGLSEALSPRPTNPRERTIGDGDGCRSCSAEAHPAVPGWSIYSLGLLELFLAKFGPSRHDGLEMRAAERRIGRSVVGIEIDRALEERGRFVVLIAAYMRHELATAQ